MTQTEYAEFTRGVDRENGLEFYALGLCEESGELAGKIKRIHRDDNDELTFVRKDAIVLELGDVFWYFTRIADRIGVDLDEIRARNVEKLTARTRRGTLHGEGDNR